MIPYYPAFLDLRDKPCTVVGGGQVAARKIEGLLNAQARIRVISPRLVPTLEQLAAAGAIAVERRRYQHGDLAGAVIAVAATDDVATNDAVWTEATERGVLVNVSHERSRGSFIVPAVLRRGDVTIAISTGGMSPALAGTLRRELDAILPDGIGDQVEDVVEFRARIRAAVPRSEDRERVWRDLIARGLVDRLRKDDRAGAEALIDDALSRIKSA